MEGVSLRWPHLRNRLAPVVGMLAEASPVWGMSLLPHTPHLRGMGAGLGSHICVRHSSPLSPCWVQRYQVEVCSHPGTGQMGGQDGCAGVAGTRLTPTPPSKHSAPLSPLGFWPWLHSQQCKDLGAGTVS